MPSVFLSQIYVTARHICNNQSVHFNICFAEQYFYRQKRTKSAKKRAKLFKKIKPPFREQSLFLLVHKKISNITFQEAAERFKVIPCNSLSGS